MAIRADKREVTKAASVLAKASWMRNPQRKALVENKKKVIDQIVTYVSAFLPYFIFCTFLVFITALVTYLTEWNKWSLLLFLITLGCQMFLYIHFN